MTLLEFIDRWHERRVQHPRPLRDIRQLIGFAFLAGYYWMVWQFSQRALPEANLDLIRDAMLTLGPPVGLIVGAMFRSELKDEQAARNTESAFRAVQAAATAGGADPGAIRPGDTVQLDKPASRQPAPGEYGPNQGEAQ